MSEKEAQKKVMTSVTLSAEGRQTLSILSDCFGVPRSTIIELAIRHLAAKRLPVEDQRDGHQT